MRGNAKPFGKQLLPSAETPNYSGNNFRQARKLQTIRETTFAMRGNIKPFRKWLSPCAETPNHSGNNFRHARKRQTIQETTFAMRGNTKPLGKRLSPCTETPNLSGNDFRHARKHQTFREMICGRPAKYINKKALWRNESSKCFVKGGGYPLSRIALFDTVYHRVNWGVEDKQKSVYLIAQMNALIKRRRLPTLPHCIAVPSAQVGLTSLFGMGRGGTPPQ